MKTELSKSFEKDILKVKDKKLALKLSKIIDSIEETTSITTMTGVKKMEANDNYYRLRVGDYRIGFVVKKDVVVLLRFMHRKEIYRYFP